MHQPVVARGYFKEQWLVFCDACSAEKEDYVWLCRNVEHQPDEWPPRALYEQEKA